jgi:hypothetical protein
MLAAVAPACTSETSNTPELKTDDETRSQGSSIQADSAGEGLPSSDAETELRPIATGDVTGIVRDASGTPVPMVNLSLEEIARGAMTGPGGEYSMRDIPAGEHEVTAAYPGGRKTVRLEVLPDSTIQLDIQFDE